MNGSSSQKERAKGEFCSSQDSPLVWFCRSNGVVSAGTEAKDGGRNGEKSMYKSNRGLFPIRLSGASLGRIMRQFCNHTVCVCRKVTGSISSVFKCSLLLWGMGVREKGKDGLAARLKVAGCSGRCSGRTRDSVRRS